MGTVISKKVGKISEKSLPICHNGTPRVTTNSIIFTIRAMRRIRVKVNRPKKNGGRTSATRYRKRVLRFTLTACYLAVSAL